MTKKRFKDFGSGKKVYEPLSFKLHGEEFDALPAIQGKTLIEFAEMSTDPAEAAKAIPLFFSKVLTEESYNRFDALLSSEDKIVEMETLGEIVGWLMEEYTNRPEEQLKS